MQFYQIVSHYVYIQANYALIKQDNNEQVLWLDTLRIFPQMYA